LRLDGGVRGEYEAGRADPARQLDAEQGLARPRRGDDVRAPAARLAVALEGLQRELLVPAPGAGEAQARESVQPTRA
jgi:hypothetical protein